MQHTHTWKANSCTANHIYHPSFNPKVAVGLGLLGPEDVGTIILQSPDRTTQHRRKIFNPKVHYHIHKSPPLVCVLSQIDPCVCLVFRSRVDEDAIFLEYDVTSLGNLLLVFRGNEAISYSSLEMSKIAALGISMPEEETITFSGKVEDRLPSVVISYLWRKENSYKFIARNHVPFLYCALSLSLRN